MRLRANIDGASARGLTPEEFQGCLHLARTFKDYPATIAAKAAAVWRSFGENCFSQATLWTSLLGGRTSEELKEALFSLIEDIHSAIWNAARPPPGQGQLQALAERIRELFKPYLGDLPVGPIGEALQQHDPPPANDPPRDLLFEALGLSERDGQVVEPKGSGGLTEYYSLVANFLVLAIRSGTASSPGGHTKPVHIVEVVTGQGEELELEIFGSVYDPKSYEEASEGALTVPAPKRFKEYVAYKTAIEGVQVDDPAVDRTLLVGTYLNDDGDLVPNDGVAFPNGSDDCLYDGHQFAQTGSKKLFRLIARLQKNHMLRVLLVWALGTLLKPKLGWAYPHCEVTADAGVGKDTIGNELLARFDWLSVAGPAEFESPYRAKRAVANSVLPIQVQELGRLDPNARRRLTTVMNLAYNMQPTTHGTQGKTFTMCTPSLLWGQDTWIKDVALSAKLIRLSLASADKCGAALRRLQRRMDWWPMAAWAEFVCSWANQRDVAALAAQKVEWLRKQVARTRYRVSSTSDRIIWNHGVLLVVAVALRDFGVSVRIENDVVALLRQHLQAGANVDATVARQVLRALLTEIQKPGRKAALVVDLTEKGLFLKPGVVLEDLRRAGYRFDISSGQTLQRMLYKEKLGTKSVQHRLNGIQSRFFLVPPDILAQFDFRYDAGTDSD